jgi:hypothetical protein
LRVKLHEFMAWVDGNVFTAIIVQRIFRSDYLVRANCEVSVVKEESHRVIANLWFDLEDTEFEHSLRFVPMNVRYHCRATAHCGQPLRFRGQSARTPPEVGYAQGQTADGTRILQLVL